MSRDEYFLSRGAHKSREDGMCAMEWTSYLAGEDHTDAPACVSPILVRFFVNLNDLMPDAMRQRLRPYLARAIGTVDDGRFDERKAMFGEWYASHGGVFDAHAQTWTIHTAKLTPEVFESTFDLLERLLPTEPVQIPVVEEWREVCALPELSEFAVA